MSVSYRDGVAIGEIVVYVPALTIALFLAVRHGFGRSVGWIYLVIFALARIIGSCFQLATISDPNNTNLYIGASILQNIGISPLELATLGLLGRVVSSIDFGERNFIIARILHLLQLVVIVGLILGIVGGVNASSTLASTGVYQVQSISKVSVGLFIGSFVIFVIITIATSFVISRARPGEKRILAAVGFSLPFLLVRLIYSAISTFAGTPSFNSVTGNVTIYLCMALIEELIIVITYEACGLTLQKKEVFLPPPATGKRDVTPR